MIVLNADSQPPLRWKREESSEVLGTVPRAALSASKWQGRDLNPGLSEEVLLFPRHHVIPLGLWMLTKKRNSKVDLMAWCMCIFFSLYPALAL